ncbi:MAG: hypothetical protein LIP12_01075 [Clostridiales bacterium]|nr:hypothetical protein [Clostridiales bacterium]
MEDFACMNEAGFIADMEKKLADDMQINYKIKLYAVRTGKNSAIAEMLKAHETEAHYTIEVNEKCVALPPGGMFREFLVQVDKKNPLTNKRFHIERKIGFFRRTTYCQICGWKFLKCITIIGEGVIIK